MRNTTGLKRTAGPGRPKGLKPRLTVERIETELRHLATFDPRRLLTKIGRGKTARFTLREMAELPDEVAACISSWDVVIENLSPSDGRQETVVKVRWYDKIRPLELCAKHFGWATEHLVIEGLDERKVRLNAARARVAHDQAAG